MLGLNSLYNNIIGWLSIAELGVGSAIIFSLYIASKYSVGIDVTPASFSLLKT